MIRKQFPSQWSDCGTGETLLVKYVDTIADAVANEGEVDREELPFGGFVSTARSAYNIQPILKFHLNPGKEYFDAISQWDPITMGPRIKTT